MDAILADVDYAVEVDFVVVSFVHAVPFFWFVGSNSVPAREAV
jgi:hypothetical protein